MSGRDGGPVSPIYNTNIGGGIHPVHEGFSLRDYFAARAMQSYLNFMLSHVEPGTFPPKHLIGVAAMSAFDVAETMVKISKLRSEDS